MVEAGSPILRSFGWLRQMGLTDKDLAQLNSCVPGEFLQPDSVYVNTGAPRMTFGGSDEATLPFVAGRWYFIPAEIADAFPALGQNMRSVAEAPRLIGE